LTLKQITNKFISIFKSFAIRLGTLVFGRTRNIETFIDKEIYTTAVPLVSELFANGRKEVITLLKRDVLNFVRDYNIPIKYNKDLIDQINDTSIFRGYYDKRYKEVFTRRELYNLKQTILSGKYAGLSEAELTTNIRNTINITKHRAQLLARTETTRLRETMNRVYYTKNKGINKEYNLVWKIVNDGKCRHPSMEGKIAGDDGLFDITGYGRGSPGFTFNCRCRSELIKKKDKNEEE